MKTEPVPVPIPTEEMLTPGAVTSGLSALSPDRGPKEVKLASPLNPGLAIWLLVSVTVWPSAPVSAGPAEETTHASAAEPPRFGVPLGQ